MCSGCRGFFVVSYICLSFLVSFSHNNLLLVQICYCAWIIWVGFFSVCSLLIFQLLPLLGFCLLCSVSFALSPSCCCLSSLFCCFAASSKSSLTACSSLMFLVRFLSCGPSWRSFRCWPGRGLHIFGLFSWSGCLAQFGLKHAVPPGNGSLFFKLAGCRRYIFGVKKGFFFVAPTNATEIGVQKEARWGPKWSTLTYLSYFKNYVLPPEYSGGRSWGCLSGGGFEKENTVKIGIAQNIGVEKRRGGVAFKNGARGCVRKWGAYVAEHKRPVLERAKMSLQWCVFWAPFLSENSCLTRGRPWFVGWKTGAKMGETNASVFERIKNKSAPKWNRKIDGCGNYIYIYMATAYEYIYIYANAVRLFSGQVWPIWVLLSGPSLFFENTVCQKHYKIGVSPHF